MFAFQPNHLPSRYKFLLYLTLFMVGMLSACQKTVTLTPMPETPLSLVVTSTLQASSAAPTANPPSAIPVTPTFTHTPSPTSTPASTATPTTPSTVLPGIALDGMLSTTVLLDYVGLWSPTYDEMVSSYPYNSGEEQVALAIAPDFLLRVVDVSGRTYYLPDFSWSPDGSHVLLGTDTDLSVPDVGELWRLDRQGENAQQINDVTGRGLEIVDWLDERTLVTRAYSGGGHYDVNLVDFLSGKVVAWASLVNGPFFKPSKDYVPIASEVSGWFQQFVITRQKQARPFEMVDGPYARSISADAVQAILPESNTVFRDWLPGTNQMLVYAFQYDQVSEQPPQAARLLIWDVDKDKLIDLAPNGVDGRYSPDGHWLALVTLDPAQLDDEQLTLGPVEPLPADAQPHLVLIERDSGRVSLNIPVAASIETSFIVAPYPNYAGRLAFSPDNRYLAFVAPDASGSLLLNVIELESRQIVQTLLSSDGMPVWSPPRSANDLSLLAYRNEQDQWQVFDPSAQAVIPITLAGGEEVFQVAWSPSGQYLSLHVGDASGGHRDTLVVLLP